MSDTPKPRRIDGYLSNRAQQKLDPRALVIEESDSSWVLEVAAEQRYSLGWTFHDAKQALDALIKAERARSFGTVVSRY